MPTRVRTRVGARKAMEGARSNAHHRSQESGRQIRFTAVMRQSRTSRHIVRPKDFPRFSATTAEEGRTGAALVAVLVSLFFDMGRAVLRWAEDGPQELRLDEIGETYGR